MSTPNLLQRDSPIPRSSTFHFPVTTTTTNLSSSPLPQPPGPHQLPQRRGSFASSIGSFITSGSFVGLRGPDSTSPPPKESDSAGNPTTPILTLLPIHNEPKYYDTDSSSSDDSDSDQEHHSRSKPRHKAKRHPPKENLASLSPTSAFDHSNPRYFDDDKYNQAPGEEPVIKRYQLYDPPVPSGLFDNDSPKQDTRQSEDSTIHPLSSRSPLFLDIIREEDEEGHSRRPSQIVQEDSDSDSDYKDDDDGEYHAMEFSRVGAHSSHDMDRPATAEERYDEVRTDLDQRLQQAVQKMEQHFADRVQQLERRTSQKLGLEQAPEQGLDLDQGPLGMQQPNRARGAIATKNEILSNTSQQVDDLDTRVNAMEYLVSFKLHDIESKVQELHNGHSAMTHTMHQAGVPPNAKPSSVSEGDLPNEMQRYQNPLPASNNNDDLAVIDKASIIELRQELKAFGTQYNRMNDGLLSELVVQLREAKLMLYENVDQVDQQLGQRTDRIEAEMHAKRLSDIENRIQERVRAMEQTSVRLERCFDKMEGRLGALETVLSSKQPRSEAMYQQQNSDLSDRVPSPESPRPTRNNESSLKGPATRANVPHPLRIRTSQNSLAGPHSAEPTTWARQRAMTIDNLASPVVRPGSAGDVRRPSVPTITKPTQPQPKVIRRPSSYKELLHFWKAGESTPDLLKAAAAPAGEAAAAAVDS
ncbi:hypothetical protein BGX31_011613 [Mortierella sp. GBA43]|nr:hypothetical protein BGX31_011613 [Mortierella sp. GBA43]